MSGCYVPCIPNPDQPSFLIPCLTNPDQASFLVPCLTNPEQASFLVPCPPNLDQLSFMTFVGLIGIIFCAFFDYYAPHNSYQATNELPPTVTLSSSTFSINHQSSQDWDDLVVAYTSRIEPNR